MCRRPSSFSTRTVYTTLRQGWMMKHIQSLLTISATRIIPLVIRKSRNVAFGRKPSHSTSRISRYSTRASRARNSELSKRQTSKMWSRKCIRLSSEDVISELTQRNRRLLSDTGGTVRSVENQSGDDVSIPPTDERIDRFPIIFHCIIGLVR